jgi:hypothetical protein
MNANDSYISQNNQPITSMNGIALTAVGFITIMYIKASFCQEATLSFKSILDEGNGTGSLSKPPPDDQQTYDDNSSAPSAFIVRFNTSAIWRLQTFLMSGYIPTVRPVRNASEQVNVTIDLVLYNLISLVSQNSHCTLDRPP